MKTSDNMKFQAEKICLKEITMKKKRLIIFLSCIISFLLISSTSSFSASLMPENFVSFDVIKALAKKGDRESQFALYYMHSREMGVKEDLQEAKKWLRASAEAGFPEAQMHLAANLFSGIHGFEQDIAESAIWAKKAAESGIQSAAEIVSYLYYLGLYSFEKDHKKAYEFAKQALDPDKNNKTKLRFSKEKEEYEIAHYVLGSLYLEGEVVEKNANKFIEHMKKSAQLGFSEAMYKIGKCYAIGCLSIPKNIEEGKKWLTQAAEYDIEDARKTLESLK